jgi:hypothetical protein
LSALGLRIDAPRRSVSFAGASVLLSLAFGYMAGRSMAPLALIVLAGLAVCIGVLVRPYAAIALWLGIVLADGRTITHIQFGSGGLPLYTTEVFLALAFAGLLIRAAVGVPLPRPPRFVLGVFLLLGAPSVLALALETNVGQSAWLRNFALIYYAAFALLASLYTPSQTLYKRLLLIVSAGSTAGLFLVFANWGGGIATNTGAVRLAGVYFAIPVGVMPLILVVLVREGLLSRRWLFASLPFLFGIVEINHRSSWLALGAALFVALHRAPGWKLVILGALCVAFTVTLGAFSTNHSVAAEIVRAKSIANTSDPNAHYRLTFSGNLLRAGLTSPLFGRGFDNYPASLLPPRKDLDRQDPHDSWVAMAYRIGLLPTLLLLAALAGLVVRSVRVAARSVSPHTRAALFSLASIAVYLAILSALNVLLEAPYAAAPFWMCIGFLATLVQRERTAEVVPHG